LRPDATPAWTRFAVIGAALYYALLLTDGTGNLFGDETLGLVYNDMALRLLHWDFTADPGILAAEGFLSQGRTVSYFGILPALLRLPLIPLIDLHTVQVGRLSCWLALSLAAWVQASLLLRVCRSLPATPAARGLTACALAALLFSGPQLGAAASAGVYYEPIVWASFFVLLFLRVGVGRVVAGGALGPWEWAALGACAGAGLCARATAGLGMIASLGVLAAADWLAAPRLLLRLRAWPGALALFPLLGFALAVNDARWGNPFTFVNYDLNTFYQVFPLALAVRRTVPDFRLANIPVHALIYLFGPWPALQRFGQGSLYPPGSFLAADATALLLLGAAACRGLRRRWSWRMSALLLAPGLQVLVMLAYRDTSFRYRYEFLSFLAVGAAFGARELAGTLRPPWIGRAVAALVLLTAANIADSHIDVLQAKLYGFARTPEERARIIVATAPFSRWFALPH
jgi:hypothetical protein